jgi:hypothetical protein
LPKEATKEGTGKKWAKQKRVAKLGKTCTPIGMMVVVAGNLPGRSLATRPDAALAHRSDGKL